MSVPDQVKVRRLRFAENPAPPTVELAEVDGVEGDLSKHLSFLETVVRLEFAYPKERFAEKGVVICGGGAKYFPNVYVLVRLLRSLGCVLPIEVWHLGMSEITAAMRGLLAPHGVECRDAQLMRRIHPARRLGGWELKCYAMLHSRFAEVLLLDADNCPVRDPEFLFEARQYRKYGAIFWPDFGRFAPDRLVWKAARLEYRDEPEFESGQIVVDKARCWRALNVAMHLNEHSEWWYRVIHGDKDTFHLAWRKIGQEYAMTPHPVRALDGVMLQYDFAGRLLFQHRNFGKWTLHDNRRIPGFRLERECLGFIAELRTCWSELPPPVRRYVPAGKTAAERVAAAELTGVRWDYHRLGHGRRPLVFLPEGRIGEGAADCERYWDVRVVQGRMRLEVFAAEWRTFTAWRDRRGGWRGHWERFEGSPVELQPFPKATATRKKRHRKPAAPRAEKASANGALTERSSLTGPQPREAMLV